MARQDPEFSPDAIRQLRKLRAYDRRIILEGVKKHLADASRTETSRNKFRLRRTSEWADYELRLGDLGVFYRIDRSELVIITLIGIKKGRTLVVEGEEFEL